jgi:hypothetical protein
MRPWRGVTLMIAIGLGAIVIAGLLYFVLVFLIIQENGIT